MWPSAKIPLPLSAAPGSGPFAPYWEEHREGDAGIGEDQQEEHLHQEEIAQEAELGAEVYVEAETGIQVEALSDLVGREIRDPQDEALAKIDDFMIDTREGHLAYAILSYGGVFGIGVDYVAVPYQALELDIDEERFVLDTDQDTLDRLAFDAGDRPDMTDEQWTQQVHEAFGQDPYWQVYGYAPPSKVVGEEAEDDVQEDLDEDVEEPEEFEEPEELEEDIE